MTLNVAEHHTLIDKLPKPVQAWALYRYGQRWNVGKTFWVRAGMTHAFAGHASEVTFNSMATNTGFLKDFIARAPENIVPGKDPLKYSNRCQTLLEFAYKSSGALIDLTFNKDIMTSWFSREVKKRQEGGLGIGYEAWFAADDADDFGNGPRIDSPTPIPPPSLPTGPTNNQLFQQVLAFVRQGIKDEVGLLTKSGVDDGKAAIKLAGDTYSKALDQKVSAGIDIVDRLSKDLAAAIDDYKKTLPKPLVIQIGSTKLPELPAGSYHKSLPSVARAALAGMNVLLVGPAGCGKTTLASQVAKAAGKPFFYSGAVANEFKLTGFITASGVYVSTAFRQAFTEGGLFLFDEVDASDPSSLLTFNQALANRALDFPDGNVSAHKSFVCLAAANTYGHGASREYIGRNQLDGAFLDRFVVISMDYDEEMERALVPDHQAWAKLVQKLRAKAREFSIRAIFSTRAIVYGATLFLAGAEQDEVMEQTLWRGLPSEQKQKLATACGLRI